MTLAIDEATRIATNRDSAAYREMRYKRETNRRIERLEALVVDLTRQLNDLKGPKES